VQPNFIVEHVGGLHVFTTNTDKGRQWLASWAATAKYQRLGKFVAEENERDARDLADVAVCNTSLRSRWGRDWGRKSSPNKGG
jgi:hypothetical protein